MRTIAAGSLALFVAVSPLCADAAANGPHPSTDTAQTRADRARAEAIS